MKKKLINYLKLGILLLGISFGLIYCKEDPIPLEETHVHHDSPYSITRVNCYEIEQNAMLSSSLEELNSAIQKAQLRTKSGSDESDIYNFTIDIESANYMENKEGTYHSYTFAIKRDYDYGYLENLLLAYNELEGYKAYLIKYDITLAEKKAYFNGQHLDLTDKVKTIELDISNLSIDFRAKQLTCVWILIEWCRQGNHDEHTGFDDCSAYSSELTSGGCTGGGGGPGDFSGGGGDSGEGGIGDNTGTGGVGDPDPNDPNDDPDVTTPIDCRRDCPPAIGEDGLTDIERRRLKDIENCEKLQDMLDPAKANIKPQIERLKKVYEEEANYLTQGGEAGAYLKKTGSTYTNDYKPLTRKRSFNIKVGNDIYGAIHTHPFTGMKMFSYADVFGLLGMHDAADPSVKSEVTLMLICDGSDETFAIKVSDVNVLRNKLYTELGIDSNTPEYIVTPKLNNQDYKLGKSYDENYEDLERGFLDIFKDYGVTLYKSDANTTSFVKRSLPQISGSTAIVNSNCNEL